MPSLRRHRGRNQAGSYHRPRASRDNPPLDSEREPAKLYHDSQIPGSSAVLPAGNAV